MDIVKKNLISIICGVVALLAIVAAFVPLGGLAAQLQGRVESSKKTNDALIAMRKKARTLPSLQPRGANAPLEIFPNAAAIEAAGKATEKLKEVSLSLLKRAVETNRREPLVPEALPAPGPAAQRKFRDEYRRQYDNYAARIIAPMNPGMPLSPEDLTQRIERVRQGLEASEAGPSGRISAETQAEIDARLKDYPKQIVVEHARSFPVYVEPDAFPISNEISPQGTPDVEDIWWAQVLLWTQQDVAAALAEVNHSATGVADAPLKHLRSLVVEEGFIGVKAAGPGSEGQVAPAPGGEIPRRPEVSMTGRASNSLYDVQHFTISAVVDAETLPGILMDLCRDRFITVLNVNVRSVDSAVALAQGYAYGERPVLDVVVQCEKIYFRDWTTPLMPAPIKRMLGVPDKKAAGATPKPATPPPPDS